MKVRETNQNKYSCYLLIRMDSNQTHTVPPEKSVCESVVVDGNK